MYHQDEYITVTCGWYKKGSALAVKSFLERPKNSFRGFDIQENGELFSNKPERFDYETIAATIDFF